MNRTCHPVEHPILTWEGGLPRSLKFADGYASLAGAIEEKRQVFLTPNGLPERWRQQRRFVIGETGFGTGLNFLLTWELWRRTAPPGGQLHYLSIERYPLTRGDLARAHRAWPTLAGLAHLLQRHWPPAEPGCHLLPLEAGRVRLFLLLGDVQPLLEQMQAQVHAWYLDGFAPARNPAMWSSAVLQQVARLTAPGGTFATFTAAGAVRRGLAAVGFAVEKVPGFGPKRESLRGYLVQPPAVTDAFPWFAAPSAPPLRHGVVIGAGLAGTATAQALVQRGWDITVVERHGAPAKEASGNRTGILLPLLAAERSLEQRWFAAAYRYGLGHLARLGDKVPWSACGILVAAWYQRAQHRQATILERLAPPAEVLRAVDAAEASILCGLPMPWGGLYLGEGGWVHPPGLCRAQLDAAGDGLQIRYYREALALRRVAEQWQLLDADGREIIQAPVVILAGGRDAVGFAQAQGLALQTVRGQVTTLPATPPSRALHSVVCGCGYATPVWRGSHCIGASYGPGNDHQHPTPADDAQNVANLRRYFPALATALQGGSATGRVAFRAVSPDRLPLVGPVPAADAFRVCYRDLHHGRDPSRYPPAPYHPGLFINAGHGSRGLVSTALAAEVLAALLEEEPLPLAVPLLHALHPARFLIRELRKAPPSG